MNEQNDKSKKMGMTLADVERDVFPALDAMDDLRDSSDRTLTVWKLLKELVIESVRGLKDDDALLAFLLRLNLRGRVGK